MIALGLGLGVPFAQPATSSGPTPAELVASTFADLLTYDAVIAAWSVHDTSTDSMSSSRSSVAQVTVPDGAVGQLFDRKDGFDLSAGDSNNKRPSLTNGLTFDDIDDTMQTVAGLPSLTMTAAAIYRGTKTALSRAFINQNSDPRLEWNVDAVIDVAPVVGGDGTAWVDGVNMTSRTSMAPIIADGSPHLLEWRGMNGAQVNNLFNFSHATTSGVAGVYIPICFMDEAQADLAAARAAVAAYSDALIAYLGL